MLKDMLRWQKELSVHCEILYIRDSVVIEGTVPGDILATRNTDAIGNGSPGWWNHTAIISINGWVIEAQEESDAVIAVPFEKFQERYPEILAFSVVPDTLRIKIAKSAIDFIGLPYRKVASLFPAWRRPWLGENCVSVIRKTIVNVTGRDPGWRRPDHIVASAINNIDHKINYFEWIKPATWHEGMTKSKSDITNIRP